MMANPGQPALSVPNVTYIPSFQLLHFVFATTITVWLNQVLQSTVDYSLREIGMFAVLAVVLTFIFGVFPSSVFLESMSRGDVDTASRLMSKTFGAFTIMTISTLTAGVIATGIAYAITTNLVFSLTFLSAFVILLVVDLVVLTRAGR